MLITSILSSKSGIYQMNTDSASTAEYFGATIVLLSISTSLTVLVLNVHHRGSFGQPVPAMVRLVVLGWLARMLGLGKLVQDKTKGQINTAKTVGGTRKAYLPKMWAMEQYLDSSEEILAVFVYVI